jgi:hypothetical protein
MKASSKSLRKSPHLIDHRQFPITNPTKRQDDPGQLFVDENRDLVVVVFPEDIVVYDTAGKLTVIPNIWTFSNLSREPAMQIQSGRHNNISAG